MLQWMRQDASFNEILIVKLSNDVKLSLFSVWLQGRARYKPNTNALLTNRVDKNRIRISLRSFGMQHVQPHAQPIKMAGVSHSICVTTHLNMRLHGKLSD